MKDFLQDFQATLSNAVQQLEALAPEQANLPKGPGKWTSQEILGHLLDSATNNHQRFVRVPLSLGVVKPGIALDGYQQNDWVRVQHYQEYDWQQLISLWHLYNLHLLHVVRHIPDETLSYTFRLNGETVGLEFVIRDYLKHMKHHLAQILGEQL
jgi:hypothetical protein